MFDRKTLAFVLKDKPDLAYRQAGSYRVELLPLTQLQYAI